MGENEKKRVRKKREPKKTYVQKGVWMEASILADIWGVSPQSVKGAIKRYGWNHIRVGGKWIVDTGSFDSQSDGKE